MPFYKWKKWSVQLVIIDKYVGALSAEQAKHSMFDEQYQRLEVLIPDIDAVTLLEELMGTDINARREYIFENVDFSEIRE